MLRVSQRKGEIIPCKQIQLESEYREIIAGIEKKLTETPIGSKWIKRRNFMI